MATVAGVPFGVTNLSEASDWLLSVAMRRSAVALRLANAYCVALASSDSSYRDILLGDGVNLPDGAPVVWVLRRRGLQADRVRGPSFFVETLDRSQGTTLSHFFLGATDETLSALRAELQDRYPEARLAGSYAPPFGELDEQFYLIAETKIRHAMPDIVWVGLGTPKQDFATYELANRTGLPCVGVGAAFDFVAGTVAEAPVWVQNSGFEWLFRLLSEPRRLWKRYLFGNTRFIVELIRARNEK